MRLEEAIGINVMRLREMRGLSQAQLGDAIGAHLDKPWSRQAVSAAEKGRRAFTAVELVSLALVLGASVPELLELDGGPASTDSLLPGGAPVTSEKYEQALFRRDQEQGSEIDQQTLARVRRLFATASHLQARTLRLSGDIATASMLLNEAGRLLGEPGGEVDGPEIGAVVPVGEPVTMADLHEAGSLAEAFKRKGAGPASPTA